MAKDIIKELKGYTGLGKCWLVCASEFVGPRLRNSEPVPFYPDESDLSPNTETYIYLYYMVLFLFLGDFLTIFLVIPSEKLT